MPITINKRHIDIRVYEPKVYVVSIIYDKYVSWEFCMKTLKSVFHKSHEEAQIIANDILTIGEGICGVYMHEIAESKAGLVEKLAKKEGLSMRCFIEEI